MSAKDLVFKVDAMKTSRVVARMLGGMLFISGAGILLNSDGYRATAAEFLGGVGLIYMSGIMALVSQCLDEGLADAPHPDRLVRRG